MNFVLALVFLLFNEPLQGITINGAIEKCIQSTNIVDITYSIKNATDKDVLLDVYGLQFSWEIKDDAGNNVPPINLVDWVVKTDTSNYLIKNRYIKVRAFSELAIIRKVPMFSN